MPDMPSVELLTTFATAPSGKAQRVTGFTYVELVDAMKVNPDEAAIRFRALLGDARRNVREWACFAGAKACGRRFVPALLEAFNDRSQDVQESAMWSLLEIEPNVEVLHPLMLGMRQRLLTWDEDRTYGLARLLALLNDTAAAPYLVKYLERQDIDAVARARAEDYLLYFTEGMAAMLNRIRKHTDHTRMAGLCRLAFEIGSPDVDGALEDLLATAPDERCRAIANQALDALKAARTQDSAPYWKGGLEYQDLPRL